MSEELRPCPTCGEHTAVVREYQQGCEVICDNPDCPDMSDSNWEREFAIELWNTRPLEDALKAELAQLRTENADLWRQLGEYDAIRAKQARYEMYFNDDPALSKLSECLRGCIGEIEKQYPTHAWGLSLTIENIEAMVIDRTELRAELARKDELIKRLDELVELYDSWTPLGYTIDWANKFESASARVAELRGEASCQK